MRHAAFFLIYRRFTVFPHSEYIAYCSFRLFIFELGVYIYILAAELMIVFLSCYECECVFSFYENYLFCAPANRGKIDV